MDVTRVIPSWRRGPVAPWKEELVTSRARMEYGIQHRSIYLAPPSSEELEWFFGCFDDEEIWTMFGYPGPSQASMRQRHASGNLIIGIIKRVEDEKRIGFVVEFPPAPPTHGWEFGIAIPDPRDRNLKAAIEAGDAWAHYFFDHLRIETGMWRVREDNGASNAFARRMGFRPYSTWEVGDHRYQFYRMDKARWEERLARIEAEDDGSSGEELFITLKAPYKPVRSA